MKKTLTLFTIGALVVVVSYNYIQIEYLKTENIQLREALEKAQSRDSEESDIEVADVMTKLQRHANKLWFSGVNDNWELANFYITELDEAMHEISEGNVMEGDVNISTFMNKFGLNPLEELKSSLASEEVKDFENKYAELITNCNNCHVLSGHKFVVIKTPVEPVFDNQEYSLPD